MTMGGYKEIWLNKQSLNGSSLRWSSEDVSVFVSRTRKYIVLTRPTTPDTFYFVGKAGALRFGKTLYVVDPGERHISLSPPVRSSGETPMPRRTRAQPAGAMKPEVATSTPPTPERARNARERGAGHVSRPRPVTIESRDDPTLLAEVVETSGGVRVRFMRKTVIGGEGRDYPASVVPVTIDELTFRRPLHAVLDAVHKLIGGR